MINLSAEIAIPIGIFTGALLFFLFNRYKIGTYKTFSNALMQQAERETEQTLGAAKLAVKELGITQQLSFEEERRKQRSKSQKEEERLQVREDKLDARYATLEQKLTQLEKKELSLSASIQKYNEKQLQIDHSHAQLMSQLEQTSGLTQTEAKEFLYQQLINDVKADAANEIRRIKKVTEEQSTQEAGWILSTAINRLAVPCISESTVVTVVLPNMEMKGRIIGREGRNIKILERLTGVNFLIDDTPNAVVISGFDPIRLHIAKTALNTLVADGRIHPTSIEESVKNAKKSIDKIIFESGEDAAVRTGQFSLDSELIKLLGMLKFRHSYGQNVLDHSIEVSHLMGMIAAEMHLDVNLAKRIGLLHDIGKAVSHEVDGTHAIIGHNIALKHGEAEEVANGIGCHHKEMEPLSIEASFCGAIDAISASRPGARIEAVDQYIQRLKNLEEIAYQFPGIEKAYAMQAGREIVISVFPEMIDDAGTLNLAREISKKIEEKLNYPGKIKVSVIREKRAVEYAV